MKFENIEQEIDNILDLDASEMTPEQQAAVDAYLEELAGQEAGAVDGFARYVRMKIAMAAAKREEAQRLMQSARSDEGSANYLKMRFIQVMQARNLTRVKGHAYKVSIRSTPVVQIFDEKALPEQYVKTTTTTVPDKLALRDALKGGAEIPGAALSQSLTLQVA
jgi:hypothetical protein